MLSRAMRPSAFLYGCSAGSLAALTCIAIDSSAEAQTLAGGDRLKRDFILAAVLIAFGAGVIVGLVAAEWADFRDRRARRDGAD